MITPSDYLSTLIMDAKRAGTIQQHELTAAPQFRRPRCLLIVGTGEYQTQLLRDVLAPYLYERELGEGVKLQGQDSNHIMISNALGNSLSKGKVLCIQFAAWNIQGRPVAFVVAATGKRQCETVKEIIMPVLQMEESYYREQALKNKDMVSVLPQDVPAEVNQTIKELKENAES